MPNKDNRNLILFNPLSIVLDCKQQNINLGDCPDCDDAVFTVAHNFSKKITSWFFFRN